MASLNELNSWHSDWQGLRVAVIGLGVTGFSAADTLAELGCEVTVFAQKAEAEFLDILDVLGVEHVTGEAAAELPPALVEFAPELIVTSPGVRPNSPIIEWAVSQGIPVWVDIELAWRLRDKTDRVAQWVLITGTNGKTTTTQLVTEMLRSAGHRVAACGNIGTPILDCVREPEGFDYLVVEVSSFQLHYLGFVSPVASAILNIDQDHIDWHGTFDSYVAAKAKVYANTQVAAIFNVADAVTIKALEEAEVVEGCRAIGFTVGTPGLSMVGFVEEILCDRAFVEDRANTAQEIATLEDLSEIGVVTPHLMANVAAATALARACDVTPTQIREAIRSFRLDKHRIELVAFKDDIAWVDDSKATNPHATAASLASFEHVVWLVGGLLKGVDITPLVEKFASRLRGAVVIGVDREPVLAALESVAPHVPVIEINVDDKNQVMTQAVSAAANLAQAGDTVLLAPASASMDQFKDYADRGTQFANAVRHHLEGAN
ncbi:MAG: UDP-N-acetylmuramoyl-L-alanine--D-glutamate ligase [Microbacteriaceae bacterium]